VVEPRILIVSPVRNEAAHIERVVRAVAAQDLAPARWIVRDDDSTDDTLAILRRLEAEVPFLTVLAAEDMPKTAAPVRDRLALAAEVLAFDAGLRAAGDLEQYTHVMKLDGDIELPPDFFSALMARFAQDPRLGLAGCVLDEPAGDGTMRRLRIARSHVHGATKLWTRECFVAIGGIQARLGWDTIDETYARMHGYGTRSFDDLVAIHHRPIGSADGSLRGHARHGECAYIAHYQLWWALLRAGKVATRRPYVLSGAWFFWGYVRSALRGVERVPDREYRVFARRELRRRIVSAVSPRG
jgi:biofilm PGA synthesis N-glycosyltransferase PgaC